MTCFDRSQITEKIPDFFFLAMETQVKGGLDWMISECTARGEPRGGHLKFQRGLNSKQIVRTILAQDLLDRERW